MDNESMIYGWNADLVAISPHFGTRMVPITAGLLSHPVSGAPLFRLVAVVPTGIPGQHEMTPYNTSIEVAAPMPYATPAELENAWPRPMAVIGSMIGSLCGMGVVTLEGLLPLTSAFNQLPLHQIPEPDFTEWPHDQRPAGWHVISYDVESNEISVQ